MVGRVHLTEQVSFDELRRRYRNEKNSRVEERLLSILHLYEGKMVKEVSKTVKRSERSIERWVVEWNENGYDGLIPRFRGGPKPKLEDSEWDKVVKEIENKGMTLKDVAIYVKDTRGVNYGYKGVWEVLRRKRRVPYGKAYKINRKRPPDAEEILKRGSRNQSRELVRFQTASPS
jgi:putative transposase